MKRLIGNSNFRLFWIGEGISLIGDQFYLIALPWLVLQLTGDPLIMGTVLAVAGIPRALFMLFGGVFADKFTPRRVMLVSNLLRMILVGGLATSVLMGVTHLWLIYAFALGFGLADAFFYPAQSAIVPQLVDRDDLQLANTITQGTVQLSMFAGPMLAGIMIAAFSTTTGTFGVGIALAVDAVTFLASAATLWFIRVEGETHVATVEKGVITAMRDGIRMVWREPVLRVVFILIAAANFLIVGPINVGIPILANTRLPEGAAAFGIIMSAFGGGSLIGLVLAATLPRPREEQLGLLLTVVWSLVGLSLAAMGLTTNTPLAAATSFFMGIANSYVTITFITWLQLRVPDSAMGRVMSLMMFFSSGLVPLSNALSGFVANVNLTALFVGFGLSMTVLVLISMAPNPRIRRMEVSTMAGD